MIENLLTEGDFQPAAKARTSNAHKTYLDGGRKDLIQHGAPFNQSRPVDNSNAFLAKESEDIEEASTAGGGGLHGHAGSFDGFTDKDNKEHRRDTKK